MTPSESFLTAFDLVLAVVASEDSFPLFLVFFSATGITYVLDEKKRLGVASLLSFSLSLTKVVTFAQWSRLSRDSMGYIL